MQKSRPYLVSISNEKYNYFLRYLAFFWGKRGPKPKNGEVRSQVSTTFSEVPPSGLTHGLTQCRSSWQTEVIPALVSFFGFGTHFFDFGPVTGCHAPYMEKNRLNIRMQNFILSFLKKKNFFKTL